MLALIAAMRHVLSSQMHRRFNADARGDDHAATAQAPVGRRAGGALPVPSPRRRRSPDVLRDHRRGRTGAGRPWPRATSAGRRRERRRRRRVRPRTPRRRARLRQARHDVHVAGWALALARRARRAPARRCAGRRSRRSRRPRARAADGRVALAPRDLRLPGGRTPHDFLRTDASGERIEVERFETRASGRDRRDRRSGAVSPADRLIVELDDRLPVGRDARKLERYDHFLAGWSLHTPRYGRRAEALPVVVFVCRDRARARECARRADSVLRACRAYAGEYPLHWQYPGRERILFVAERDAHEGLLRAYGVPRMPPDVRVMAAHGDPRARRDDRRVASDSHGRAYGRRAGHAVTGAGRRIRDRVPHRVSHAAAHSPLARRSRSRRPRRSANARDDLVDLVVQQAAGDQVGGRRRASRRRARAAADAAGWRAPRSALPAHASSPSQGSASVRRSKRRAVELRSVDGRVLAGRLTLSRSLSSASTGSKPEPRRCDREHARAGAHVQQRTAGGSLAASSSEQLAGTAGCSRARRCRTPARGRSRSPARLRCRGALGGAPTAGARAERGPMASAARTRRRGDQHRPVELPPALAASHRGSRWWRPRPSASPTSASQVGQPGQLAGRAVDGVLDAPPSSAHLFDARGRELQQLGQHQLGVRAARRERRA